MFGYGHADLAGRPVESLIPADLRAAHCGHRAGYARVPRARPMGDGARLVGLRKDGTTFPVQVSLSPVPTATGHLGTSHKLSSTSMTQSTRSVAMRLPPVPIRNHQIPRHPTALSDLAAAPDPDGSHQGRGGVKQPVPAAHTSALLTPVQGLPIFRAGRQGPVPFARGQAPRSVHHEKSRSATCRPAAGQAQEAVTLVSSGQACAPVHLWLVASDQRVLSVSVGAAPPCPARRRRPPVPARPPKSPAR